MGIAGFTNILVDIDARASVHPALDWGARLARRSGAQLTVVDVVADGTDEPGKAGPGAEERRARLERIVGRVRRVAAHVKLLRGRPAKALIDEVARSGHDLVVRAHARDLAAADSQAFGAIDRSLLRQCPCAVLLVGQAPPGVRPVIAAAVDARRHARQAQHVDQLEIGIVRATLGIASLLRAPPPIVLYAWSVPGAQPIRVRTPASEFAAYVRTFRREAAAHLDELVAAATASGRAAAVRPVLRRGAAVDVIPRVVVAAGVELIVMGTVARTGMAGLVIGNTSERLLRRLPCAVLVLRRGSGDGSDRRPSRAGSSTHPAGSPARPRAARGSTD